MLYPEFLELLAHGLHNRESITIEELCQIHSDIESRIIHSDLEYLAALSEAEHKFDNLCLSITGNVSEISERQYIGETSKPE